MDCVGPSCQPTGCILIVIVVCYGVTYVSGIFDPKMSFPATDLPLYEDSKQTYEVDGRFPVLIWWTSALYPHYKMDVALVKCGNWSCYSSMNRTYLSYNSTRGMVFYGTDIDPEDLPLPRQRRHEWGFIHEESPMNNYMLSHTAFISLFNHTATFSRYSNYPITTHTIPNLRYVTGRKHLPVKIKNDMKKTQNLAPVFYAQSHQGVPSDRDRYVAELMKHISVDSYGTSLHNRDLPDHLSVAAEAFESEEFINLTSMYKFHLAFENAICDDYMTEKLMRPLHVGSVPVYKGSKRAKDWMPNNHSIILVDDFDSPKELADFIKYLDDNDEEYEKYLQYKISDVSESLLARHLAERNWGTDAKYNDLFAGFECHMCTRVNERLHNKAMHAENNGIPLAEPSVADQTHMGCQQPYPQLVDPDDIPLDDKWWLYNWSDVYWVEYDKARAARKMVESGETNSKRFKKYLQSVIPKQEL